MNTVEHPVEFLIITGLSGAGRRTAAHTLEDHSWYVVDNLPPELLPDLLRVVQGRGATKVAVVADVRTGAAFEQLPRAFAELRRVGVAPRILYLDASDDAIVQRQESVRRPLPLQGADRLLDGIRRERASLAELRATADVVIDTTDLNARQLADVRKNMIGLVFQKFYLVPHLTAVENVMVAQYYHSVVDEKQAMEALERVGLKERAHHLPGQLSGGEQQRVCIARALINCPKLILADEPTGNLDEKNEKIVLDLFRQLHEQGTTIIVVTHDALVASCAQREIMLNHGVLVGEQWNDEEAKRAYEAAGGKPAFTGSAAEGAQNGGIAISFADPTKAAKTGDTDAANVAVAAGVADDTDVEPDVTKGEQA